MAVNKVFSSFAATLALLVSFSAFCETSPRLPWPIKNLPIVVGNTACTLQFYGDKPAFHHGLDILDPAGTPVYAPVSGKIAAGYYYRIKIPYTFEISIKEKDGTVWQFHHLDPRTIPASLLNLASRGGNISNGAFLGRIYNASEMGSGISPHVHINVISPKGRYQEPLRFFPTLKDDVLPVIRGMYLIDSKNRVLADDQKGLLSATRGFYPAALIVDAFDVISPSMVETTPASIRVFALLDGGKRQTLLGGKDFYQLPGHDFFSGVSEVYQVKPLLFPDGRILKNQVEISPDLKRARRFLFRFPLSKTKIPSGVSGLKTVVRDFAGNQAVKTWIFPKPLPVSSAQFHKAAKLAHSLYPAFD